MTALHLPDSVTKIGEGAFDGCKGLEEVVMSSAVRKLPGYVFNWCEELTSFSVPDHVTEIGECAFKRCHSLCRVVIPRSVCKIHPTAFEECENLLIAGESGSAAEKYAKTHGIPFAPLPSRM